MRTSFQLTILAIILIFVSNSAHSQDGVLRAEKALLESVNEARHEQGLPALRWNQSLAEAALRHARIMTAQGTAQHGFEGEPDLRARVKLTGMRFSWLSENVTQGPTPEFIHAQFMHSPPHRANILDTDMNSVGIGVVEKRGQLFAVEDFSQTQ